MARLKAHEEYAESQDRQQHLRRDDKHRVVGCRLSPACVMHGAPGRGVRCGVHNRSVSARVCAVALLPPRERSLEVHAVTDDLPDLAGVGRVLHGLHIALPVAYRVSACTGEKVCGMLYSI